MSGRRDHYSYTVYADPATARTFDARRFGGPIGEMIARDQADTLKRFLGDVRGKSILDVGTGTGRAALLLAADGAHVTGVDASSEMLAVARTHAAEQQAQVQFDVGDAHALRYPDRAFDCAVSLRVLMHTPRWQTCVAELCRVARDRVLIDYPSLSSVAALQAGLRHVAHGCGAATEPYRVFSGRQIARSFEANGFRLLAVDRQFVLPIAVHKALGSPGFTTASERLFDRAGLLRLLGSPVTVVAERC